MLESVSEPYGQDPGPPVDPSARTVRRPVPFILAGLLPVLGFAYGILAALNPILGQSPSAVILLSLLFVSTLGFMMLSPNGDRLDAFRVTSLYYSVCFCVAPLFMLEIEWHYANPIPGLATQACAYVLGAYWMIALGYYAPILKSFTPQIEFAHGRIHLGAAALLALALFGVGLASFILLFVSAGGAARLLGGDEGRGTFFEDIGYLFWASLFCYGGGVLFFATRAVKRAPLRWLHAWPLAITFMAFLVLQGRQRAFNALVLGLFVSHYLIRPLRLGRLGAFAGLAFVVGAFIGMARDPDVRFLILYNPSALLAEFAENFWDTSHATMTHSFARLRQIMVIFDKVPEWMPRDWGASILNSLNPVFRLLGFEDLQVRGIGPRLYELTHPELRYPATSGYLPSLVGEFLVNFPWYLAFLACSLYGILLRVIYNRLILGRPDAGSIALYAILMLYINNMIITALGQNIFEIMVLVIPTACIVFVSRRMADFGGRAAMPAALPTTTVPR